MTVYSRTEISHTIRRSYEQYEVARQAYEQSGSDDDRIEYEEAREVMNYWIAKADELGFYPFQRETAPQTLATPLEQRTPTVMLSYSPNTALIADDNLGFQTLIRSVLEFVGYEVESVFDGQKALETLKKRRFHVLFLELNLPILSGNGVLEVVRSLPGCQDMFIVVVTANPRMLIDEMDNADFVMMKPIQVEELAKFAERIHNRGGREVGKGAVSQTKR